MATNVYEWPNATTRVCRNPKYPVMSHVARVIGYQLSYEATGSPNNKYQLFLYMYIYILTHNKQTPHRFAVNLLKHIYASALRRHMSPHMCSCARLVSIHIVWLPKRTLPASFAGITRVALYFAGVVIVTRRHAACSITSDDNINKNQQELSNTTTRACRSVVAKKRRPCQQISRIEIDTADRVLRECPKLVNYIHRSLVFDMGGV